MKKMTKSNYLESVQTPGRPQWGPADSHARPRIHGKRGKYWGKGGIFQPFTQKTRTAIWGGGGGVQVDQNPRYGIFYCILLIFY